MGFLQTRLVWLLLVAYVATSSASETEESPMWTLDHSHHHHHQTMMEALCGSKGERCDPELVDLMHSFRPVGRPCGKGSKFPRQFVGPRDSDEGETTMTSLIQSDDGLKHRKIVIMVRPILGRRGGPFPIEDVDAGLIMENMIEKGRELRKQYMRLMDENDMHDIKWTDVEDMMMKKAEVLFRGKHAIYSEEEEKPGWKAWFRHCLDKINTKKAFVSELYTPLEDDSIMSSLRGIDWRLWDAEGQLNTGLILFVVLVSTSIVIWTSLMVQLVQYILYYYYCPVPEYDELDDEFEEKIKEHPEMLKQPSKGQDKPSVQ